MIVKIIVMRIPRVFRSLGKGMKQAVCSFISIAKRGRPSATNSVHGARRRHETGGVDLVTDPFLVHGGANDGRDVFVRGALTQRSLYVCFVDSKKAIAQLAVAGEA